MTREDKDAIIRRLEAMYGEAEDNETKEALFYAIEALKKPLDEEGKVIPVLDRRGMRIISYKFSKGVVTDIYVTYELFGMKEAHFVLPRKRGEWISKPKRIQVDETDEERIFETRKEWFCASCGKSFGFRKPEDAFCKYCGSDNRPRENNSSSMIINGKYSENVEYGTRVEIDD